MYKISDTCQIANLNAILMEHFGYKTDGTFVEVGAYDGYSWSNTWGLAEAGWRGLLFEPLPELAEACGRVHATNNVKVFNCCAGEYCGHTTLWLDSNPTIDKETMEKSPWGDKYNPENCVSAPVVTLDYQLATEEWPEDFDWLGIDVEGAEMQVLRGINLMRWRPTLLVVETHEENPDPRRSFHAAEILHYVSRLPYTKIQVDGLNTIWKRNV